jgi:hypothetical protein
MAESDKHNYDEFSYLTTPLPLSLGIYEGGGFSFVGATFGEVGAGIVPSVCLLVSGRVLLKLTTCTMRAVDVVEHSKMADAFVMAVDNFKSNLGSPSYFLCQGSPNDVTTIKDNNGRLWTSPLEVLLNNVKITTRYIKLAAGIRDRLGGILADQIPSDDLPNPPPEVMERASSSPDPAGWMFNALEGRLSSPTGAPVSNSLMVAPHRTSSMVEAEVRRILGVLKA